MKRNISFLIIILGLALLWFIGFTDEGQGMGRDLILWLRDAAVPR